LTKKQTVLIAAVLIVGATSLGCGTGGPSQSDIEDARAVCNSLSTLASGEPLTDSGFNYIAFQIIAGRDEGASQSQMTGIVTSICSNSSFQEDCLDCLIGIVDFVYP